jgi:hypothetical protein
VEEVKVNRFVMDYIWELNLNPKDFKLKNQERNGFASAKILKLLPTAMAPTNYLKIFEKLIRIKFK